MSAGFLGTGVAFPGAVDERGRMRLAMADESIRQSIRLILETSPGERTMRPDFGCGLHDLVFGLTDAATAEAAASAVEEALATWEPRIDVLSVDVEPDPSAPNVLLIEIAYRARATNSRFNLVYPFYVG